MTLSVSSKERLLVALSDIQDNPYQIRGTYDDTMLGPLITSIEGLGGLIQIPIARRVGDKYQLACGHRRKRAFERLSMRGLQKYEQMPLDVMELTDREMFEISLSENLKREDFSPMERAEALKLYMVTFEATSAQAAKLFNIPESTVRGTVRLLKLPADAKRKVRSGQMSQHQARKLLERPDTETKRLERLAGFDLREQLTILFYGKMRSDVSDEALFKKVREIVDTNKQLEHQVELMNGRKLEVARLNASRHKASAVPVPNR